ncbi:MAG: cyclic nucleotide-binding domain-containing protein [Acidimicrobiia bacterium]
MRHATSVTSISWIPSEAMSGPMRLPMDVGIGHYDDAPPDRIDNDLLDRLRESDALRFANHLEAWVEVEDGDIVDVGYSGGAIVGATTARLGVGSLTFPGVGFPPIQSAPERTAHGIRFVQSAGGRTGSPFPRRIDRPPYVRITAPTAWTTLALTIAPDGTGAFEVVGASPFPRHWIYDSTGALAAKSGTIDFTDWTRTGDHDRTPWGDEERPALIAAVESAMERSLSGVLMGGTPRIEKLPPGGSLTTQGEPATDVYLVLDGMLVVDVDGEIVAELGPGAIVGERASLESGVRTSTVRASTPVTYAAVPASALSADDLREVATTHRREG